MNTVRIFMALLMFVAAGLLIGLAVGAYTPVAGALRAPAWLVAIGGLVFAGGGLAVLFPHHPAVGWSVAMVILASLGIIALWVGLAATPEEISGGLPLLSREANVRLGRAVFTVSGLLCLALLGWGLWLGPGRQRRE